MRWSKLLRKTWFLIILTAVITASIVSAAWSITLSPPLRRVGGGYVAVIDLSGTIAYKESPISILGGALTPEKVEELVEDVRADPSARAVVLAINSPGGSAAAAEEIYEILKRLREDRPVVAYISEYGASGGYYIALAADKIMASPAALTGSIGALSVVINIQGLADRLGIRAETFKSGRLKDLGSLWRGMTDEEKRLMQSMIDSVAATFIERVREARKGKIKDWDEVLTARPYTGLQAKEVGLVDEVGDLGQAVSEAGQMAGLPEKAPYKWVRPRAPSLLELLLGGDKAVKPLGVGFELLYMWPPPILPSSDQLILTWGRRG